MKLSDLPEALAGLERAARLRVPDDSLERRNLELRFGGDFIDAASNDYLGLALNPTSEVQEQRAGGLEDDSLRPPGYSLSLPESPFVSRETAPVASLDGVASPERSDFSLRTSGGEGRLHGPEEGRGVRDENDVLRAAATFEPPTGGIQSGGGRSERPRSGTNRESGSFGDQERQDERPRSGTNRESGSFGDQERHDGQPGLLGTGLRKGAATPESQPGDTFEAFHSDVVEWETASPLEAPRPVPGQAPSPVSRGTGSPAEPAAPVPPSGDFSPEDVDTFLSEALPRNVAGEVTKLPAGSVAGDASSEEPELSGSAFSQLLSFADSSPEESAGVIVRGVPQSVSVSRETEVQGMDYQADSLARRALESIRTSQGITVGAGSSRLIFGTSPQHILLEEELAAWVGLPASLLFASGYAANVGALGALLSPDDAVFSDSLNHASLIDGIRLSRARARVVAHLNLRELEAGLAQSSNAPARWVVCEAYYSMDGDGPDLRSLRDLCDRYDAHLYVDEAHSLGTFGPEGAGLCAAAGVVPDVLMAAFGKAVGSQGACVAGSSELRTWLWNRARSFVFSTAPSPLLVAATRLQFRKTQAANAQRVRLFEICRQVRSRLSNAGVPLVEGSFGPVLGLLMGAEERALSLALRLRGSGILAQAVRPPTVPDGASRVRIVLRASLSDEQVQRLVEVVVRETTA